MTRAILVAAAVVCCLTHCVGPARAADETVSPALVCEVQDAIRFREAAWTPAKCERVADAVNATASPMDVAGICVNESDMRERVIAWHGPNVADVGIMGVRCILGTDHRCTNGPAKGFTIAQLQKAETNIRVGAAILATKGSVGAYNSGTPSIGAAYEARISVLVAALSGMTIEPKRIKGIRLRKLLEQIAAAVRRGRNG